MPRRRMWTAPSTPRPTSESSSYRVVKRGGEWKLDNGYCRGTRVVAYFSGHAPDESADCKPNEVDVPLVVGMTEDAAVARLASQPLDAQLVYKPARPGSTPGAVVNQIPRRGGLSAGDEVTLVVSKARYGLLPNFVGSSLETVGPELARRKLRWRIVTAPGHTGNRPAAAPRCRGRLRTRPSDHARGRGRLTYREPSSEYRHG